MTVLIQPFTENAIKQIIRDNKNNFSAPSPSRPKKSFFPLKDQLNDLRQELIEFTVSSRAFRKSFTSCDHLCARREYGIGSKAI